MLPQPEVATRSGATVRARLCVPLPREVPYASLLGTELRVAAKTLDSVEQAGETQGAASRGYPYLITSCVLRTPYIPTQLVVDRW